MTTQGVALVALACPLYLLSWQLHVVADTVGPLVMAVVLVSAGAGV